MIIPGHTTPDYVLTLPDGARNLFTDEPFPFTTLTLPGDFLSGCLTTAVEGGIGYWCAVTESLRDSDLWWHSVTVVDQESAGYYDDDPSTWDDISYTVTATMLGDALRALLTGDASVGPMVYGYLWDAVTDPDEPDAGCVDGDAADCLFQVAALGSIVYG